MAAAAANKKVNLCEDKVASARTAAGWFGWFPRRGKMGRQESVPTDDEERWSEGAGETQLFHLPPRARRRAAPRVATDRIDGVTYLSPSQRSRSLSPSRRWQFIC